MITMITSFVSDELSSSNGKIQTALILIMIDLQNVLTAHIKEVGAGKSNDECPPIWMINMDIQWKML